MYPSARPHCPGREEMAAVKIEKGVLIRRVVRKIKLCVLEGIKRSQCNYDKQGHFSQASIKTQNECERIFGCESLYF